MRDGIKSANIIWLACLVSVHVNVNMKFVVPHY